MDDESLAPDLGNHPLLIAARVALTGVRSPSVRASYEALSARYRADRDTDPRISGNEVLAYAAARLPATLAAALRVLSDLRDLHPDWRPRSALDLGAGPGTGGWAAATTFDSLQRLTFVERSQEMVAFGRRLARQSDVRIIANGEWIMADVLEAPGPADLVIASYVLGELSATDRDLAVQRWWDAADGCLAIIEPGTPAGYARVIAARQALIERGAHVLAPCPHDRPCPLAEGDWCHFGARAPRTALHRSAKSSIRGFEDEKYSYVVAGTLPPAPGRARIIRRPVKRTGHVLLTVCDASGASEMVVSKRRRDLYTAARHARWGDRLPLEPRDG